jgi:N-acetyl-gamma-glutamyl-phosphate reductase
MVKIGIVGATGYGGRELLRLLLAHPEAEVVALASTSAAGERLDDVLPAFRGMTDLAFTTFDPAALARSCDAVFIGVPGKESMALGAALRREGARVLDIGPDFRLRDPALFRQYYKAEHTAPGLLSETVYGYPPVYREALRGAQLVAVPGCYPISVITPLLPLADIVDPAFPVVADCVSGISGAGRSLSEAFHFPEMNENLKAYKLAVHQHIPEIEQELGNRFLVQFTPHVAPLTRGILSTLTVRLKKHADLAERFAMYADEPFVRVLGEGVLGEVKHVRGSNYIDFGWVQDNRTGNLLLVCAIDNLMGGTAGMAVQCLNLMFGMEETTGLRFGGMTP